jgi:DNA polymerase-3 subunit alpha
MAIVTIDDASATLDIVCFAENYQKYRDLLNKDKLIIVEGEMSVDEFSGGYRVLARDILSLDHARERYATCLQLRIPSEKSSILSTLPPLLKMYQGGSCRVSIDYIRHDAKANLSLGDHWKIRPEEKLLEQLREMLNHESVCVVY